MAMDQLLGGNLEKAAAADPFVVTPCHPSVTLARVTRKPVATLGLGRFYP
jgi:hypothetical protein